MAIFNYNGGDIYYEVNGEEGPPIVLLHGFGFDGRMWKEYVEELSKTHTVIVPDLRGFGKSSRPTAEYTHADDVRKLLEHLVEEGKISEVKAEVTGHSFGGEIAIDLALESPEVVKGLRLISTSLAGVQGDSSQWEELIEIGKSEGVEGILRKMLENPIFNDFEEGSELKILVEKIIGDYSGFHFLHRDPVIRKNAKERVSELSCPVTLILGERDEEIQYEVARIFKEELNIEPEIIAGSGHLAVLEKAEEVRAIIGESRRRESKEVKWEVRGEEDLSTGELGEAGVRLR